MNPVEIAARTHLAKMLKSETAKMLPPDRAEAFATVAFIIGAAWAMDRPDLLVLADAQIDSIRAQVNGDRLS